MTGVVPRLGSHAHWVISVLGLWGSACVDELQVGQIWSQVGSGSSAPDAAPTPTDDCVPVACRGRTMACGDCIDDDEDGLVDAEDPECLGPCDDTEADFSTSARPCPTNDCFFEPNCGVGNDARCAELTPNGCDCRGCCELPGSGTTVLLGSVGVDGEPSCDSEGLGDPSRCAPCEVDRSCFNECADCELCLGRSSLPPACAADAECALPSCDDGHAPCGGCAGPCPTGTACVTGCCVPTMP